MIVGKMLEEINKLIECGLITLESEVRAEATHEDGSVTHYFEPAINVSEVEGAEEAFVCLLIDCDDDTYMYDKNDYQESTASREHPINLKEGF